MKIIRTYLISILLVIMFGVLAVMRVILLNIDSTEGDKLTFVTQQITDIELDNQSLMQKVASISALSALSSKAQVYGYGQNATVLTLFSPLPLALSKNTSL